MEIVGLGREGGKEWVTVAVEDVKGVNYHDEFTFSRARPGIEVIVAVLSKPSREGRLHV